MSRKTPSYIRLNYALRPAKNVERKMIFEALARLSEFDRLEDYRYAGFGSVYFSDFVLAHRRLGIADMVSIEREENDEPRFQFNRPLGCIRLMFGESNAVLHKIEFNKKTILWLDYDGSLELGVLNDVCHFFRVAQAGSVLLVTLNCQGNQPPVNAEQTEALLNNFRRDVGDENIPVDLDHTMLLGKKKPELFRRIITNRIDAVIQAQSEAVRIERRPRYKQLFNFRYADGLSMMTLGWLLYSNALESVVASCNFGSFPYVREGEEPYSIYVPWLTKREMAYLDARLPTLVGDAPSEDSSGIPEELVHQYSAIYRYYPRFVEADF